jgi:5-methyltetrahydrofolate--homocysteine methyltransferase
MKMGQRSETFGYENPDVVRGIHRGYLKAGANVVKANTFGISPTALGAELGTKPPHTIKELVASALDSAKKTIAEFSVAEPSAGDIYLVMEMGPAGKLLNLDDEYDDDVAYRVFKSQADAAVAAGGFDAFGFLTFADPNEMAIGIKACHDADPKLPIVCSFTFGKGARTFMGASPETVVKMAEDNGACLVGANCSTGPKDMIPVVEAMLKATKLPVSMQPNAGLPQVKDGKTFYDMTPEAFASIVVQGYNAGVSVVGGCCGTDYSYIEALSKAMAGV